MLDTAVEHALSTPDTSPLASLLAVALAVVHILAGRLRFLRSIPRNRWLSVAGGASVSYVFVHIFPELSSGQREIEQLSLPLVEFLEHHVYLVALLGFAIFYGLEHLAIVSRKRNQRTNARDATDMGTFALHIGSFALYNALIGYLLVHRETPGARGLLLFFVAIALHFVVNDSGLREHHKKLYDHIGRWVLAVAVLIGWGIGRLTELGGAAIAVLFAFLAGGIILNVIKEELPEERESRFWAFALGAAVYTVLWLPE
jgi:hypothetical protein